MSTEPASAPGGRVPAEEPGAPRGSARRVRRWRSSVVAVVAVLAIAVAGLTVGAALRGPRITGVATDPDALVQRPGTRVVLSLDQPVAARPSLSVSPRAAATVQVQGRSVTVTFARMLRYDTSYTLRLAVKGEATGVASRLATTVRTGDAQVYSLLRTPGGIDRVVRRSLGGGSITTVFSARRIQRFAVLPAELAVVTIDEEGDGTIQLVPLDRSVPTGVLSTPPGAIETISASGASGLLAFTVTSPYGADESLDRALYVFDPDDGSGIARPIDGLDSRPLSTAETQWIPGSTSLVARQDDGSLFLVDGATRGAPIPVGSAGELRGVVPGSARVVAANPDSASAIDLATGKVASFPMPSDGQPAGAVRSDPIVTDARGAYVETVATFGDDFVLHRFRLLSVSAAGARVLWKPALESTRVDRVCMSPNAEFLAVEVVPAGAKSDDYPGRPIYAGETTSVISLASGEVVGSLPGADPSWCD